MIGRDAAFLSAGGADIFDGMGVRARCLGTVAVAGCNIYRDGCRTGGGREI